MLGEEISMPIGISPTAMQKLCHAEGEKNTARGRIIIKIIIGNRKSS